MDEIFFGLVSCGSSTFFPSSRAKKCRTSSTLPSSWVNVFVDSDSTGLSGLLGSTPVDRGDNGGRGSGSVRSASQRTSLNLTCGSVLAKGFLKWVDFLGMVSVVQENLFGLLSNFEFVWTVRAEISRRQVQPTDVNSFSKMMDRLALEDK
jgi:hypothetical protein